MTDKCLVLFQRDRLRKDLENERMLRMDAERKMHDMAMESDQCKVRLEALQEDFKR